MREAAAEADEFFATYAWYPQRAGRADLLAEVAGLTGRRDDAVARQQIAGVVALQRGPRVDGTAGPGRSGCRPSTGRRGLARQARGQRRGAPGGGGALAARRRRRCCAPTASSTATIAEVLVSVPAQSIAGGTDEIQHNIIGERCSACPASPPSLVPWLRS